MKTEKKTKQNALEPATTQNLQGHKGWAKLVNKGDLAGDILEIGKTDANCKKLLDTNALIKHWKKCCLIEM